MGRLRHNAVIGNTRHQEAVKDIEQESRIARDRRERAALSAVQLDFRGLILEHLAKNPGDTEKSMELLLRWDEARQQRALDQEQRQVEMVRYMIDKGIVREVDVPGLREGVLGPAAGSFGGMLPPGTGAPAAAHALPAAPHPSSP
ncbi:hypothetical protein DLE01_03180, partial [Streptomyces sp. FT05W]